MIWIVVGVIVLWGVWAFGSEMLLNLRLNAQVDALRAQNARLADSNAQTLTELKTAASAAAMEESARQQGYYRQGEQVYVIVQPSPSAAPAPSASGTAGRPAAAGAAAAGGAKGTGGASGAGGANARGSVDGGETAWGAIIKWWRQVWH
ncbi:MAG: hypothetical protein E6J00_11670 [Chloroflexi bacterium]|nr:MAG: hypothetical protein E6J00_11670 [Chloroflexota bacterium]